MEFYEIFNECLTKKSISNYKMAFETGFSDSLIGYWRKGKRKPTLDNIIIIANYLEVSIDYLLTGIENNKKPPSLDLSESEQKLYELVHPLNVEEQWKVVGAVESYLGIKLRPPLMTLTQALQDEAATRAFKNTYDSQK